MPFWNNRDDIDWEDIVGWNKSGRRSIPGNPHSIFDDMVNESQWNNINRIMGGAAQESAGIGRGLGRGRFTRNIGEVFDAAKRRYAGNQAQRLLAEANQPPTTAELLMQLEMMQDPSRYMPDQGSLARQAMEMANAQYNPLIAQLESQMSSATSRAHRNRSELGQMFSTLSADLQGDVPEIQQMYTENKQESKQMFDDVQQGITDQYANSQAEQEQMMQRLNIEAAAPEALAQQQVDRDYFAQLAARDAATEQTALDKEERGAVNYTQQGSQVARLEGTQRQADVMAQLEQLLADYQGQIGAQKASKNSSYLAMLSQLQGDAQQSAVSNAQRDFENYISMIQLGRALDKDSAAGQVGTVKSPADVAGRALGMGLDQNRAQTVQDVFMTAISTDPQILSGTNIFGQSAPKEAMAERVVMAGKNAGLNRQELNALLTIALEYFGRR